MKKPPAKMLRATLAGLTTFVVLTAWMMVSSGEIRDTLVSAALVGLPVLVGALGVLWLVLRALAKPQVEGSPRA